MLREQRIVHLALQRNIRESFAREGGKRGRLHDQPQTFSRSGTGLKMRFQLLPELKSDMLKTSMRSCRRRRARNSFRDFF
jgi:hypothetical protein